MKKITPTSIKPLPRIALMLVDIQNDFIYGSLALKNAEAGEDAYEVIEVINSILSKKLPFTRIFLTMDWHPYNHISFHCNRMRYCHMLDEADSMRVLQNAKIYDSIKFKLPSGEYTNQVLWPIHCVQRTTGAAIHKDLELVSPYTIIEKGMNPIVDSYSAFSDLGRTDYTALIEQITISKIETIVICGLALDYCVANTAIDSAKRGYKTFIVIDACRKIKKNVDHIMAEIKKNNVILITSDQVINNFPFFTGNSTQFDMLF